MQPNMMNPAMRNGLILGVLFSTNFFLTVSGVPALALFSYLVTGLIIYFTHRYTVKFRDVDSGGSISFGRAYGFVLLQYIFATIISSFTKYFFLRFSKSTFLEDMYNQNMITLEQFLPTVTGEMYDAMEVLTNAQGYTIMAAWTNLLLALILGLIIAAMVKREKSPFDK